jgi:NADH-quinone oxidoreductase subunit J
MLETVLFYLISFGVILSALGVIIARSAIYSVLSLVSAMCLMAGLFVLLKAYLVATILVLVYAGAILVLFLFVVMMIDFNKFSTEWKGFRLSPLIAIVLGVLVCAQTLIVIRSIDTPAIPAVAGTTAAMGRILFHKYILPFELTSFLILAAVVSVVVLAKKDVK